MVSATKLYNTGNMFKQTTTKQRWLILKILELRKLRHAGEVEANMGYKVSPENEPETNKLTIYQPALPACREDRANYVGLLVQRQGRATLFSFGPSPEIQQIFK